MNLTTKPVVALAIGIALYGIGGLPMFGLPVYANTTLKPAIIILALFSVMFGPLIGLLIGFVGHWITDFFAGWGVWMSWVVGSGIVGFIIGFFPLLTRHRLVQGKFNQRDFILFVLLALLANLLGYGCAAYFDITLYAEPAPKVFTQLAITTVGNTLLIAFAGYFFLKSLAKRSKANPASPHR
ncbi:ECF-type riboflavin transporter substrate-binding protein [Vibrio sp. CAU 1672]|uniref:ECF-type riboflavin transporter substrate-binding protein n=1 Tax=Vibrio sp. CAU 1672 TaxID=3032594 RepID=UPI0023DA6000|nr:ECF-type riboflavin transporter substrate-binding protein [Vibrio sp. CAU 1672]MDF2152662.1 ECF-type riboflavin transporter substrate-binding protein [Vibrio sp. CAU 1672]